MKQQHIDEVKRKNILLQKYFEKNSFVDADIQSFNHFVDVEMSKIIKDIGDIVPTIIPPEMEDFRIKLDKIWITKPMMIEADGSKRDILPVEARLRRMTYSAPIHMEVSAHIDGVQRESFTTQIGRLPIMVKSKYCHLHGLGAEDLIAKGEDPYDPGGYFVLNGNERVLITVEDLAANKLFVEKGKTSTARFIGKIFSERGSYRVPHSFEQAADGIIYLNFTRFKRIPVVAVIKALGMVKDEEIVRTISEDQQYDDVFINLYTAVDLKNQNDALEFLAKKIGISQPREIKLERASDNLDRYLLPHLGTDPKDRMYKAVNLCKLVKRFLIVTKEKLEEQDKDHYRHKRLKLSGDLLSDLFRVNLRALVNDILYNYQRLVKRGKFQSIKIIIRDKLLTSRINSAMATGVWVGGRKGLSQNIDRTNYLATLSHLQRVVSLLSSTQENFAARALHPTHWGRLCAIETPEGTPIGLRKNLALMSSVSHEEYHDAKVRKTLEGFGLQ
jgi:DNA-directed RNA polymerase beta subunit